MQKNKILVLLLALILLFNCSVFAETNGVKESKNSAQSEEVQKNNTEEGEETEESEPEPTPVVTTTTSFSDLVDNNVQKGLKIENFLDIDSSHPAYTAFRYLLLNGVVNGTSSVTLEPDANLTRASFITMLCRDITGEPNLAPSESPYFKDVKIKDWYAGSVEWGRVNKVINGVDEEHFSPNQNVTKEQMVTMIYRFVNNNEDVSISVPKNNKKNKTVKDIDEASEYAIDAINWAASLGLLNLTKKGEYFPKDEATRSDMAMLLYKFDLMLVKK